MTLRIGLAGCGRWGRLILRDLLALGCEVHVVCRTGASLAEARLLGARSASTDLATFSGLDGVIVATPTATHAAVLESIVPTGLPIFVEKPMTADVGSARRLVQSAGARLFVMDKWRYHPAIEAMRVAIADGWAGEVLAIRTTRWGWGHPHQDVSPLWILAPHDLSIVLHLTGRIPPVSSVVPLRPQDGSLGLTAHLGSAEGPTVTIDIGIASPEHRRRCLVIGSRATLELRDGYDDRILVRRGAPGSSAATEETIVVGHEMPLRTEIERFLGFLRGGPRPMSSAEDGLLIVERLAEIETALAQGHTSP